MATDTDLYRFSLLIAVAVIMVPLLMFFTMLLAMGGGMMGMAGPPGVVAVVPLLLAFVFIYAGYRLASGATIAEEAVSEEAESAESDPIERLQQEYVAGNLTEAEFERRLEALLEESDRSPEDLDRLPETASRTRTDDRSLENRIDDRSLEVESEERQGDQ